MTTVDRKKQSGFTLIELLVSITIIGILSAVVYASFSNSRALARDNERKVALREVQLAIEQYRNQNGRYPEAGCAAAANELPWASPGPFLTGAGFPWTTDGGVRSGTADQCDEYIVGLVPDFISALPTDSQFLNETSRGFRYGVNENGSAYKILSHSAIESDRTYENLDEFARCPAVCVDPDYLGGGWCAAQMSSDPNWAQERTMAVYSLGAECW